MTDKSKANLRKLIVTVLVLMMISLGAPALSSKSSVAPQAITFPTSIVPTITLVPSYGLYVSSANLTIDQGDQTQVAVTVRSFFGYNKTVSLFSTPPSGISITFALSKLTPPVNSNVSTTAFISVAKSVPAGAYTVFINATDGTIKRGLPLTITVNAITTTASTTTSTTTVTTTATTSSTTPTATSPTTPSTTSQSTTTSTTTPTMTSTQSTTTTTPSEGSDMTLIVILVVIVVAVVAVAAFLLMRRKPAAVIVKRYCMHCGTGMTGDALSCPKCGKQPAGGPDTKVCPNCGAVINSVAAFCPKCGAAQPKVNDKGGTASG